MYILLWKLLQKRAHISVFIYLTFSVATLVIHEDETEILIYSRKILKLRETHVRVKQQPENIRILGVVLVNKKDVHFKLGNLCFGSKVKKCLCGFHLVFLLYITYVQYNPMTLPTSCHISEKAARKWLKWWDTNFILYTKNFRLLGDREMSESDWRPVGEVLHFYTIGLYLLTWPPSNVKYSL